MQSTTIDEGHIHKFQWQLLEFRTYVDRLHSRRHKKEKSSTGNFSYLDEVLWPQLEETCAKSVIATFYKQWEFSVSVHGSFFYSRGRLVASLDSPFAPLLASLKREPRDATRDVRDATRDVRDATRDAKTQTWECRRLP